MADEREAGDRPAWRRPSLTALARSRPGELVLASCRLDPGGGGPSSLDDRCSSAELPCQGSCATVGVS